VVVVVLHGLVTGRGVGAREGLAEGVAEADLVRVVHDGRQVPQQLLPHRLEPLPPAPARQELVGDLERLSSRRKRTLRRTNSSSASSSAFSSACTATRRARTVSFEARSTHAASASPFATGRISWAAR